MIRRSKSSSNIPIPSIKIRASRYDSANSKVGDRGSYLLGGQKRTSSSLDRKSSLDKHLPKACLFTPTTASKATGKTSQKFRPNSLVNATPRTTPRSQSRQKLTTDKNWVAKQFAKVQNFVQNSGLFDPQMANPGNIKPPTINTFVYMCNVLLKEIFPNIKIDNANYKEVVPAHLKLLRYNGAMTNSILKTVNVPNSFPQVISMLSFLVDCIPVNNYTLEPEMFTEETRQLYQLRGLFLTHNITDYGNFQKGITQPSEEIVKEYKNSILRGILQVMNIDMEKLEEQKQKLEHDTKRIEAQELKIGALKDDSEVIKKEITETRNEIDEIEEYLTCDEHAINEEIKSLKLDIDKLQTKEEETKREIRQLEACIASQTCSFKDKKKLLLDIGDRKRRLPLKKEKNSEMMKIKDEFDFKVVDLVNQIETEVYRWNSSIMKASISNPDIKKLALRERNFATESFAREICEIFEHKSVIENTYKTKLSELKKEIDHIEKMTLINEKELNALREQNEICIQEIETRKCTVGRLENEIKDLLKKQDEEKKTHLECLQKIEDGTELDNKKTIADLEKQKEETKQELLKTSKKCLNFFLELNNIMVNKLNKMDSVVNDVRSDLTGVLSRLIEEKKEKLEIVNALIKDKLKDSLEE